MYMHGGAVFVRSSAHGLHPVISALSTQLFVVSGKAVGMPQECRDEMQVFVGQLGQRAISHKCPLSLPPKLRSVSLVCVVF